VDEHIRTERLTLDAVTAADLDDVYALHADPEVWLHMPSGRHAHRSQSARMIATREREWTSVGLSYWAARADGEFVGMGGCSLRSAAVGEWWNLYYRFAPSAQGQGYAGELVSAALASAARLRPQLPVVAYVLEHNAASIAVALRAGLEEVWRGPDAGNEDPDALRLIYVDRPVSGEIIEAIAARA
jgi:RimJ/RimL family protein N-acetyltransferase